MWSKWSYRFDLNLTDWTPLQSGDAKPRYVKLLLRCLATTSLAAEIQSDMPAPPQADRSISALAVCQSAQNIVLQSMPWPNS